MKFKIYLTILFSFLIQLSFSQNSGESKYEEAKEAYYSENYVEANSLIKEVKKLYKSIPPKVAYLEVLIKNKIIELDPYNDFSLIDETRKLVKIYKNKYVKFQNDNYQTVIQIGINLNQYPNDLAAFNAQKEAKIREETIQKEREEKEAADAKLRREKEVIEAKARQEREALARKERLEQEKIKNEQLAIEREKNRIVEAEADRKRVKEAEEYRKKAERENKRRLYSFSSLGFQSGEIAKYGFIYEHGGRKTVGFRFSARTSLTPEEDILNGKVLENKTEIELGPNFKIFKWLYFNIGVGYGFYDRLMNNDYAGELYLEKTGYTVATTGLMFRLGRIISINGGASFMDIDKDFYKPEITFGISFNLKGKYKY